MAETGTKGVLEQFKVANLQMTFVEHRLEGDRASFGVFEHPDPLALGHHRTQHCEATFVSLTMKPV